MNQIEKEQVLPFYGEYLLLFVYVYAYARFKFDSEVVRKHCNAFNEFMD